MKKALMGTGKGEKEREALDKQISERISKMDKVLECLYMGTDIYVADLVHGLRKNLKEVRHIFFCLLIDDNTPKEILEEIKKAA